MKNSVKVMLALVAVTMLFASCTLLNSNPEKANTMIILSKPAATITDSAALKDIATVKQCFNATSYPKAYSLKTIIDEDCWYKVEDDFACSTGSIGDIYLDTAPYSSETADVCVVNKYVAFMKDVPGSDYDAFVGRGQKSSYECWYKAYIFLGNEAVLFVPGELELSSILLEGLNLNEDIQFVNAKFFDFTDVNGNVVTLSAEQVEEGTITLSDDMAHAIMTCGDVVMEDLYSITPAGFTKDSTPVKGRINRFVVALSAKSVYGKEAPSVGNVAGTYYDGIPVADIFAAYGVVPEGTPVVNADNSDKEYEADDLLNRVLIWHKSNLFTVLKKNQIKNVSADQSFKTAAVKFDNASIVMLTADANFDEVAEGLGFTGDYYEAIYADGRAVKFDADAAAQLVLTMDTEIVAINAYNN